MTQLHKLIETRANVWEQIKAHLDTAEAEGRSDTVEADQTYVRMHTDLSDLDARISAAVELEKRNADADELRAKYAPKPEAPKTQDDADVLRRMVAGEVRGFEFRDLSKLSAGAGANTVPTSFLGQLQAHMIDVSAIRQTNVRVITTDSGEALQVPKTTAHSSAAIIAEAGSITESDPAFGMVTLDAFKYALAIQVSSELEQDTGVDLAGYLAMQAGRALGNASGAHFVTGTGSSQPNGVVTASTLGVTGSASVAGAFTADNLVDLYYSVIASYRRNGYWLLSDAGIKAARKLKDADNQYLWAPGLVAGEPSTLLGRPVVTDPNVAAPALSAKSVVFGDMSAYMIRDVRGVRVERSADYAFGNDLVTWRFILRTDGDLIDTTGAVKHFIGNAA